MMWFQATKWESIRLLETMCIWVFVKESFAYMLFAALFFPQEILSKDFSYVLLEMFTGFLSNTLHNLL